MNYWSQKICTQFEDIKDNDRFQEEVGFLRMWYGIPDNGYKISELESESDLYFELFDEVNDLLESLELPYHLRAIVTQYVIRGEEYNSKKPQVTENFGGYCYLDYYQKSGDIHLVMKSGVKPNDITKLIKKEKESIDKFFKEYGQKTYSGGLKRKPTKERARQLYFLLENKILKRDGHLNEKNAKEYLKKHNAYSEDEYSRSSLRNLGFEIPNSPATTKMILQRYLKIKRAK